MKPKRAIATTPGCRAVSPGARLVRVSQRLDGRPVDRVEALAAMTARHWAWPYRDVLRGIGAANGWHLYELWPEDQARVDAHTAKARRR
jgi:hypothetical protein